MAAQAGDLTDIATVKAMIGKTDTTSDAVAQRLVSAASETMRSLTSRQLIRKTYTSELRNGSDALLRGSRLYTKEYPVNSVSSVKENDIALSVASAYSTTAEVLALLPDGILVRVAGSTRAISGAWAYGLLNIALTYNAGWDFPRLAGQSGEFLLDGSFESWVDTATLSQWVAALSGAGTLLQQADPHAGTYSALLTRTSAGNMELRQAGITGLVPGSAYDFTQWFKTSVSGATTGSVVLRNITRSKDVQTDGATWGAVGTNAINSVASPSASWVQRGVRITIDPTFAATDLYTLFLVAGLANGQTVEWDEASIKGPTGSGSAATDLPWDLEQATAELAALMFNERLRLGEGGKNFAGWSVNFIRTLNPMIASVIKAYERGFRT